MLKSEWPSNNLYQKLKSKTLNHRYNILYHSHGSIFDPLVMSITDDRFLFIKHQNNPAILDINYNFTALNSVFVNAEQIDDIFNTNADLLIFNHDDLSKTKREDLLILQKNIKNVHVINFNRRSDGYISNAMNCNYAIPEYGTDAPKTKDLLIFNLDNNNMINNIASSLQQKGINVNIVKSITFDIKSIFDAISPYKAILDFSSRLNVLCGLSCGCNIITNMNLNNYPEKDLITNFKTYDDIYKCVVSCLAKPAPLSSIIKEYYSVNNFNSILQEISK